MNITVKIKYALLLLCIVVTSCEYNVEEELQTEGTEEEVVELCNPDVSFVAKIKPIIDNNCIRCHNGSQFPDLRTYTGVSNSAQRVQIRVVNRTMPIGGALTNDEIELIRCWVENGALNN
ncbi:hypothetical protein A8C32_15300 [Flavivirga aquatica]|uniref:Cytochrome c domain-containing protein n=1 Tax=Flavivirga aquatica TaxID=1849968 RepID=A0A1E5T924_9FLAO|nr:hypothetical protein [Flavivirga aquatica]OEK07846.1 hypothetical protein A8C32_15300 [Flavivirga aquatica]